MKIRKLALAGLLILTLTASGCLGSKKESTPAENNTAAVTPTPEPAVTEAPQGVLVNMEKVEAPDEYSDVTNILGEKTASASRVLIINQTGDPIEHIFIRAAAKDDGSSDEWGSPLAKSFEWPDQEQALYYFENNQKDLEGNTSTSYDIRISYENVNKSELYYRNLPLPLFKELRLCVDISGAFGVPYARYITINGNREYSTLQEVRTWYGLDVENTETTQETQTMTEVTPTPVPAAATDTPQTEAAPTATPVPTEAPAPAVVPEETTPDPGTEEYYEEPDPYASTAQAYVGQSLGSLIGAMGSPSDSEYSDEPGMGRTGHHYYGSFSVTTTVDEDGNEIITNIW